MIVRARQVIQVNDVDGAEFLGNPNDHPRYQHESDHARKKIRGVANSYDRRMLEDLDQIWSWIMQRECDSNLEGAEVLDRATTRERTKNIALSQHLHTTRL